MTVDLSAKIPNNVDLDSDPRLRRALEAWQPKYVEWWKEVGPSGFQTKEIYLRTAVDVGAKGWANFDYVRMPEYRWGIFLSNPEPDRRIGFGDHADDAVWTEVPGEHRAALRRLIVTQADTEPASVEQQRKLGAICPSLYDLRNLFQVNVEEGRHLWAMVYLLHRYFGRDGRDEGDELLARRAGSPDKPRILATFNQPVEDWLDFFMFTMFTDRDGKFQLLSLAESAFEPLARSCQFMLTEEAHHLFVGETGIGRVVERSAELTRNDPNGDASRHGGIELPVVQRYLNLWFSSCLEIRILEVAEHDRLVKREVAARLAINEDVRDAYIRDCQRAVDRWNRTIEHAGVRFTLRLPNRRFHRVIGEHADHWFTPTGEPISAAEYALREGDWLPTPADRIAVRALQTRSVTRPGEFASWIAPPLRGVNGQPVDFEYVRFD
jgi:benzoyl-CoA 2,3-dioxygenase component B